MALADRLNQIVSEQNISKTEFARRLGITVNYVYILTPLNLAMMQTGFSTETVRKTNRNTYDRALSSNRR